MRVVLASLVAVFSLTAVLAAQAPAVERFDVASIKRNHSVDNAIGGASSRDTYRRTNATLRTILIEAYGGRFLPWEIVGGPAWLETDKFDVIAKTGGSKYTAAMVQTLLADRFMLRTHEEVRGQDVYRLVMDRPDRRVGPNLVRSAWDRGEDAKRPVAERRCRFLIQPGRFDGKCATIDYLIASTLQATAQRRIVDETGLTGDFDIDLTWAPAFELPPDQRTAGDAPSIFTAVREQLGLRLEPGRARLPVLVIDSVEPPTED